MAKALQNLIPVRMLLIMWMVYSIEFFFALDLGFLGVLPRSISGLIGILTSPLVHGSPQHIVSNSFPILFLGLSVFFFYPTIARWVFYTCYFMTGVMVWIFGRPFYHIGASGVIYGLAFFLMFIGLFRKDFKSLLLSITVVVLYGGLFYGILPTDSRISFESHFFGAVVGTVLAYLYRKKKY
ncbi:rhomboid family intramembrane serine protease [Reichenbachiella versicolor]|uniref:rhomboid family intramembrane serine protease n=1 Tax=Reichenbachiella versicolor TaxID=1821036 RepID=UPI001FE66B80|nr:rhomboid family intramembrane serine protease [Reichenbachiella versicolor]